MKERQKSYLRIIARVTGIASSLAAIYFIIFIGMDTENKGNEQIITINTMFAFLIFGFVIAWFREKEGGIILTFGSIITYMYFSYLPYEQFPIFWMYSFMFAVPGLLFLYLNYRKKKT